MVKLEEYGIHMWPEDKILAFRKALLDWYDKEKRDLPWRRTHNPYFIWISEIMLQQTQVVTVIPYYQRFIETFPTIKDLAEAEEEPLLKVWEGLGYYSRVRNMQAAAQQIMSDYNGVFPNTHKEILSLKGIGPYTAGAIASIAFNLVEPAVDGNVMRVMARLFEVDYDIGVPANRKIFQAIMEVLIDPDRPGDFNQALMDLGTDIESPKTPHPEDGPVWSFSAAYLNGTMDKYPIKEPKKKPIPVSLSAFVIQNKKGEYLLKKNTSDDLLAGFWSFPLFENPKEPVLYSKNNNLISAKQKFESEFQQTFIPSGNTFEPVTHVFSHRKWLMTIEEGRLSGDILTSDSVRWIAPEHISEYPLSGPQKKLWNTLNKK